MKHFGLEIRPLVEGLRRKRGKFRCQGRYRMQFSRAGVTPYCDLSLNGLTIKEADSRYQEIRKRSRFGT